MKLHQEPSTLYKPNLFLEPTQFMLRKRPNSNIAQRFSQTLCSTSRTKPTHLTQPSFSFSFSLLFHIYISCGFRVWFLGLCKYKRIHVNIYGFLICVRGQREDEFGLVCMIWRLKNGNCNNIWLNSYLPRCRLKLYYLYIVCTWCVSYI